MQRIKLQFLFLLAIGLIMAGGCSGIYPYKNNLDKNLLTRTKTDSGSFFTSVKARVDLYTVDKACKTAYQGTVDLKKPEVLIGLPDNGPSYLDFVFSSSSFLANAKGSTAFDVYFTPRSGYEYLAEARYVDGIYAVIVSEKKHGSKKMRELDLQGLNDCRAR